MTNDLNANWPSIVQHFERSIRTSKFYTFATVNPDGSAHATPMASLVLNDNCSGYFSEVFPGHMANNMKTDQRICILAVQMGFWYWIKSLVSGRFAGWPGIRLYGSVGERRKAQAGEIHRWRKRMKHLKNLKGYKLLWRDADVVRDVSFTRFEPVRAGAMTRHLM